MAKPELEPWTIPLHILMWTTLVVAFVMVIVVVLMN